MAHGAVEMCSIRRDLQEYNSIEEKEELLEVGRIELTPRVFSCGQMQKLTGCMHLESGLH